MAQNSFFMSWGALYSRRCAFPFHRTVLHRLALLLAIAIAAAMLSAPANAQYSLNNQPPNTWYPYAGNPASILNKKLPADVMSHRYTSPQGVSGDRIAQWVLTAGYTQSASGFTQLSSPQSDSLPGGNDMAHPIYYATSSDPWYWIVPSGVSGGATCSYFPKLNVRFHAPKQAHFSGGVDQNIVIFDQAQHLMISLYRSSFSVPQRTDGFPSCTATSSGAACKLTSSLGATGCDVQRTDGADRDWGWMGYETYGNYTIGGENFAASAGVLRGVELMNGINHALLLTYACSNANNSQVFPSTGPAAICGKNPNWLANSSSAPPNGALLFLDYTDAQITNMHLPTWQTNILRAIAHYGGYLTVTSGNGPLNVGSLNTNESGQSWADAGHGALGNPVYGWLENSEHVRCVPPGVTAGSSACRFNLYSLQNIPANIPGPACSSTQAGSNQCGISKHIHIADPCVAKGLAGQTGGCF